ncbi:MAG: ABC transporter ATP-binding protein [Alphaproteobacteria bacterium]|nr:ABC transporter ATP-binding protein [Alphaproteobacteria bacterium]
MSKDKTIRAAAPQSSPSKLMIRLAKTYLRPHLRVLGFAMFFMLVAAASTAAIAQLIQPVLDDVLNGQKMNMILPVGFAILVSFIARGFSTYYHTILMNEIGQDIVADIQSNLFSHFLDLDLAFFHANPSGQLISRVVSDVNVMRAAVLDSLTGVGKNFLTLIFLIGIMFYQDWKLSLAAFAIFPFAALFVAQLGRRLRRVSTSIQSELANLSDRLSQIFQGVRQVQAYGMEDYERGRADVAIGRVRDLNVKSVRVGNLSTPVNETLLGLVVCGIIIYGGYEAASGRMTAGQLGAFLAAFSLAYEPMKKLAKLNNTLQMGLGAAERVFEMMDLHSKVRSRPDCVPLEITQAASIEFKDVGFSYDAGEIKAIDQLSFMAPAGKVIALVGPSGGGKSTVINLIPRFYDVQSGAIFINGADVRDVDIKTLRAQIALVSQDITIFDDSLAMNIGYGRAGAIREDIIEAARAAAAHEFIESFPDGYDTRVGEDGIKLSGGQRQRVSIARAILRNAPILLLDEATSALDNESEKLVQQALEKLQKGRTTVVIAHRLSTVRDADLILVLDRGKVVEKGTHTDLIEQKGLYARMYETGLKDS